MVGSALCVPSGAFKGTPKQDLWGLPEQVIQSSEPTPTLRLNVCKFTAFTHEQL
jgi:hypothetical protein